MTMTSIYEVSILHI